MCWRRRVYSFLHGLREPGGLGGGRSPPPICNEGAPFEEGCEGDFARDFLVRVGEGIFIPLVIVIVRVRKQSVKAEQQRSREAQKLKSKRKAKAEESNQQEKTTSNQSREEQQAKI